MSNLMKSIVLILTINIILAEQKKDLQSLYRDSFQYNQEIASGLYLYHIQNFDMSSNKKLDEAVGKFAVIC